RIANVGTVIVEPVVVAVEVLHNTERCARLKRGDAGDRPPAQGAPQNALSWAREIPYVGDCKPMSAVKIAWPVIQFQPALRHRYRRQVPLVVLVRARANPLAGAVEVLRPGVRSIHLESSRKAAVQAPLHGMVGRIPLAGANMSQTEIRVEARVV